jgi:hypothetical protein
MKSLGRSALLFIVIGLLLYVAADYAAEVLLYRMGDTNPLYKIETAAERSYDWVILGASHAMPLDFADFNAFMERGSGKRILNLAAPGTGPLYNRFVLESFLERHRAASLLYVADSFTFYSPVWNEERFADAKLMRRTPFRLAVARRLTAYSLREGVSPLAVLDYVTGFSKLNNRERFLRDVWEGEAQFDRVHRPSSVLDRKRIDYLYPSPNPDPAAFARYVREFAGAIELAHRAEMRVVVIKTPVRSQFRSLLPNEAAFDEAIARLLGEQNVVYRDFSSAMDEPRFYFDTDHLNREGSTQFFNRFLKPILAEGGSTR